MGRTISLRSGTMYDPWPALHAIADWTHRWAPLVGKLGHTNYDQRTTTLDPDQDQAQERTTATHELIHIERGPFHPEWEEREERIVDELTARRLIPLDDLASALVWAYDFDEAATELWVDEDAVRTRIATLTEPEGLELQRRLDAAEARFPDEIYDNITWPDWGYDDPTHRPEDR